MGGNSKIFISCTEAGHTCDKTQYKEATLWQKIKLNIHLIYCVACREYTKNNTKLTKIVNKPEVECLDDVEKESLKNKFEKELMNHQ